MGIDSRDHVAADTEADVSLGEEEGAIAHAIGTAVVNLEAKKGATAAAGGHHADIRSLGRVAEPGRIACAFALVGLAGHSGSTAAVFQRSG